MLNAAQRLAKAMAFWDDQHPGERKLSHRRLARLSGILTQQRYSQISRADEAIFPSTQFGKLADFLGVRRLWFYDCSGPMVEPHVEHRPPLTLVRPHATTGDETAPAE